jgi:dipeptidase
MVKRIIGITMSLLLLASLNSYACTNFIITKGASTDGSVMVSYSADSHVLYGELYHWPAKTYPKGTMLDIWEWDTGKYLGKIPQVEQTYNVVGNVNEFQLSIAETTFTGREELGTPNGIMDYGSLIYVTLQRAKTAREAIKILTDLVEEHGYASTGESFSICDKNEAWILELIGKGEGKKGAVWVALLIPDGYVSAHANQARITTFEYQKKNDWFNPKQTVFNSKDVISFAREMKYFDGKDSEFSFSDTYAPVDFGGARFCEIRVWAFFNAVKSGMDQYWDYAKGHIKRGAHGYATNRMPLWIKPDKKISQIDMFKFMRDHLEGTELDMRNDIGAGPYGNPYRWRPMTWSVDGEDYVMERATATQQTGFSFIAQLRSWLPDAFGAINWFSVDDAGFTVYVPMYSTITKIPRPYAVGNGGLMDFTLESAFWVFNMVSNFAYTRYELIYPEIEKEQHRLHTSFVRETLELEKKLMEIHEKDPKLVLREVNNYSNQAAERTHQEWKNLFAYLFTKYMDGNVKTKQEVPEGYKYYAPKVEQFELSDKWKRLIVNDTQGKAKVIKEGE